MKPGISNQWRAAAWMMGCVAAFTSMALSARELGSDLSVYQILFFRSAIGLPFVVAYIVFAPGSPGFSALRTQNFWLHVVRNVINVPGQTAWFYAIAMLPLATVIAIEFSMPVWGVLLAALILREYPHLRQQAGVVIGLIGVLLIARPWGADISFALLAALTAPVCFAGTWIATRMLGRNDSPLSILFWMCAIQTPIGLALSLTDWHSVEFQHWPMLGVLAASGLGAHWCLSHALRLGTLAAVTTFDYLRLPLSILLGAALYSDAVDPLVAAGGMVILAGVLVSQSRPSVAAANRNEADS